MLPYNSADFFLTIRSIIYVCMHFIIIIIYFKLYSSMYYLIARVGKKEHKKRNSLPPTFTKLFQ
jgi:hypothetical protein